MENRQLEDIVRLGPRIPVHVAAPQVIGRMDPTMNIVVPDRVLIARATDTCGPNPCETGTSSSTFTLPIILGIAIPLVGAAVTFIILQRRHTRKQREEDANDRHASLDFGLGNVPQPGRAKRNQGARAGHDMDMSEKPGMSGRQVSMDMNMNHPYLLPPELQNSRESLHSLSRSINQEDPYRPVTQFFPGDAASVRSQSKQGSSIYTGSSHAPSRMHDDAGLLPNAGRMARNSPPNGFVPPPRQNSLPKRDDSMSPAEPMPPLPYPAEPPQAHVPAPIERKGLPATPKPAPALAPAMPDGRESYTSNGESAPFRQSNNYLGSFINERDPSPTPPSPPRGTDRQPTLPDFDKQGPFTNAAPGSHFARKELASPANDQAEMGDGFKVTPPSPGREEELMRGQRYSMDVPPEEFAQTGLGAPGFDPKRLSMGFRPLPSEAVLEHDDPEIRANRIRSFYKEYFDDSKPPPAGQYHEDYDADYYGGDATYFDPETSQFVMPYAEPVTRRAMTPPPGGARPRFQGQGPPRGRNGSMGAMSASGGMRGPPRMHPSARAMSTVSGGMGPRGRPGPKRPMAPPAPLNTLPTPSKLRDDSFAMMNSLEFAPPMTYRDRQTGRSESPLGERRPYSPSVRAFTPTISAFEELAPIPSPHMLRKSGTFTSLDFAAPRKFRDPDNMSDAGSIRSNQSGISQRQLGAIRNGAYRVSRIPADVVFTKDDQLSALKPSWGMRPS